MRILVIPDRAYTFHNYNDLKDIKNKLLFVKKYLTFKQVTYESLYYSDLTLFNDKETEIIFLGKLHKEYRKTFLPEYTTNPSAYHSNSHPWLSMDEVLSSINSFDALLISYDNLKQGANKIHQEFKKRNKLIAVLDFPEDEELMITPSEEKIFRAGKKGFDFHIYFKNIIPKGVQMQDLYPIGPTPIRVKNYNLNHLYPFQNREHFLYFSGILNKEETFRNRNILINNFSKISNSKFDVIDTEKHYKNKLPPNSQYLKFLSNTQISFSPAGRAWTTTRHFISSIHGCALLLPEPDCELIDYKQLDGDNCISYKMIDKMSEKQLKIELNNLNEKLCYYSIRPNELEIMSIKYKEQVLMNHQTYNRAKYIIETIKSYV
jgi:hypothetical protein